MMKRKATLAGANNTAFRDEFIDVPMPGFSGDWKRTVFYRRKSSEFGASLDDMALVPNVPARERAKSGSVFIRFEMTPAAVDQLVALGWLKAENRRNSHEVANAPIRFGTAACWPDQTI